MSIARYGFPRELFLFLLSGFLGEGVRERAGEWTLNGKKVTLLIDYNPDCWFSDSKYMSFDDSQIHVTLSTLPIDNTFDFFAIHLGLVRDVESCSSAGSQLYLQQEKKSEDMVLTVERDLNRPSRFRITGTVDFEQLMEITQPIYDKSGATVSLTLYLAVTRPSDPVFCFSKSFDIKVSRRGMAI